MKKLPLLAFACLLCGAGLPITPARAQSSPPNVAALLGGSAVNDHALAAEHGRGLALPTGTVADNINVAGGGGPITNVNSITGDEGITTVVQNTGNNSLFQTSTTINIAIH